MVSLKSNTSKLEMKGLIDTGNTITEGCALDSEVGSGIQNKRWKTDRYGT